MRRLIIRCLTVTVFGAACREAVSPLGHSPSALSAATAATLAPASPITLDQSTGLANDAIPWAPGETHIGKGFNPNPHLGDAIVATFYWRPTDHTPARVRDHFLAVHSTPARN